MYIVSSLTGYLQLYAVMSDPAVRLDVCMVVIILSFALHKFIIYFKQMSEHTSNLVFN